jgi:phage terminase large subunit GpA-like protein
MLLPIALAFIDSGFRPNKPNEGPTNVVYDFCRRFRRFVRPTKGADTLAAPLIRSTAKVTVPGSKIPVRLELVRLDTDYWKSRLLERLSWPEDQPGGFLLASDATDDYCQQLVSEVRKVTPSGKPQWIRISRRNHYLDCEAMNEAAGHLLAAQKIPLGTKRNLKGGDNDVQTSGPRPGPPPAPAAVDPRTLMANMAARFNRP